MAGSRYAIPTRSQAAVAASPSGRPSNPAPRRPATTKRTARVTGLGGVFIRTRDRSSLADWYRKHLGIHTDDGGNATGPAWHVFEWRERAGPEGSTVWSLFPHDSDYFGPGEPAYMINYRVDDLDALLTQLEAAGVRIEPNRYVDENGRFAWITDPEGNRIELWQPAAGR